MASDEEQVVRWPWGFEPIDESHARDLEAELQRELAPEHPMHGVSLEAIGRRVANDDVVFAVHGSEAIALVHLTWSGHAEPAAYPRSSSYSSFDAFVNAEMDRAKSSGDAAIAADELLVAVERGDHGLAREMLEGGVDPREDSWGDSIVEEALARDDDKMIRLLVEFGANPPEPDERGQTRLHHAAYGRDQPDRIRNLLKAGLDPNLADSDGWTALHHAAAHGYRGNVGVLLEGGADPSVTTRTGKTPPELARVNGISEESLGL